MGQLYDAFKAAANGEILWARGLVNVPPPPWTLAGLQAALSGHADAPWNLVPYLTIIDGNRSIEIGGTVRWYHPSDQTPPLLLAGCYMVRRSGPDQLVAVLTFDRPLTTLLYGDGVEVDVTLQVRAEE